MSEYEKDSPYEYRNKLHKEFDKRKEDNADSNIKVLSPNRAMRRQHFKKQKRTGKIKI